MRISEVSPSGPRAGVGADGLSSIFTGETGQPRLMTRSILAGLAARSFGGSVALLADPGLGGDGGADPPRPGPPRGGHPEAWLVGGRQVLAAAVNRMRRVLTRSALRRYDKLHLGAGWRYLPGWGNIDLHGRRNLIWDLTRPLPLAPGSIRYIYSEHFIEHIPREACRRLLINARIALGRGGVIRISTPDLRFWAGAYLQGSRIQHEHTGWFPETPCAMINDQMRLWGHQFLYDEAELVRLLRDCGYAQIERVGYGESRHAELRELESRPPCGDLIVEAATG